jgi:hypothetical protein
MALPPIHRVDHTPVVILPNDSAWDHDRVKREKAAIMAAIDSGDTSTVAWPSLEDHPVEKYNTGASRFDLNTVLAYLLPDETPARFTLQRLDLPEWIKIEHFHDTGRLADARLFALRFGLAEVDGLDGVKIVIDDAEPLDMATVGRLRSRIGDAGIGTLGAAVINVSRELLDAEKKR